MKKLDLKQIGVQELSTVEKKDVDGGFIWVELWGGFNWTNISGIWYREDQMVMA